MAVVTDLTYDFQLNKSDSQVCHPFPLANRVRDVDRDPSGWVHVEWEHLH